VRGDASWSRRSFVPPKAPTKRAALPVIPAIRRDGRVICQPSDGGAVSDEADLVRVSQLTDGAAFCALSVASERFVPRPLVVKGTEEFRRQVAVLAGAEGACRHFRRPAARGAPRRRSVRAREGGRAQP